MPNPNPLMPCTVILDGKPYPIDTSFHKFVTAVIAMERELVQTRAALEEMVAMAKDIETTLRRLMPAPQAGHG